MDAAVLSSTTVVVMVVVVGFRNIVVSIRRVAMGVVVSCQHATGVVVVVAVVEVMVVVVEYVSLVFDIFVSSPFASPRMVQQRLVRVSLQ